MHEPIELLIVDPNAAMRGALRASLALESDIAVAGEANGMREALRLSADSSVAVAIIDSSLAALGSPLARQALAALARRVPVVVIGFGQPAEYASGYLEAGASGYWAKDGDLAELVVLLRAAADQRRPAA